MTAGNQPSRVTSFLKSRNIQDWMPMPVIEFGRHVVGCPLRRRYRSTAVRSVLAGRWTEGTRPNAALVGLDTSDAIPPPCSAPEARFMAQLVPGPGTLSWLGDIERAHHIG